MRAASAPTQDNAETQAGAPVDDCSLNPRKKRIFKELSQLTVLDLEDYEFEDEKLQVLDPKGKDQQIVLDVTALDRYNEDIRFYRNIIIAECRHLPRQEIITEASVQTLSSAIFRLCRCCYYGTHKSRLLAAEVIPLLLWLLNSADVPPKLHVIVLQSISEMLYDSLDLKKEFVEKKGVEVLCHLIRQLPSHLALTQLATYTLAMGAIGCSEMILRARDEQDIEELVGEMTFEYYWVEWPVNYGIILQGILFGPNAICPNQELFQFL